MRQVATGYASNDKEVRSFEHVSGTNLLTAYFGSEDTMRKLQNDFKMYKKSV
jgi:predicted oxidoreductase (fatty acid repression mutant protein)